MLTFKQIENEVRRLAAENPDFVYESSPGGGCYYNPTELDGERYGACIFGQAFTNLGNPVPTSADDDGIDGNFISDVLYLMGIDATSDQSLWASGVQEFQDGRVPWGDAVYEADQNWDVS